ncbi:MAG: M23 family metallopeptidase, partial [Myxococcota bacterium]
VSLADDSVVTIEPANPSGVAIADNKGAMGGPIDESDEPVLGTAPEFWITLPEAPRIMMLQWPLPATGVTSAFGDRADPLEGDARFHYGIDLEAKYGQVVRAAAAGRVSTVGWNHGHGRQITITHAGAFQTGYSHLSQTLVYEGQIVEAGEALGLVGTSGRTTGPHLHFEVMRYGSHVDPLGVLGVPIKLR